MIKPISYYLIKKFPQLQVTGITINIMDILIEMTKYQLGCCFFIDGNKKIIGLLTDGDIRRMRIESNENEILCDKINKKFIHISDKNHLLLKYKQLLVQYNYIPVLDKDNCIEGLIDYRKIMCS